jgi:hypothetical protein
LLQVLERVVLLLLLLVPVLLVHVVCQRVWHPSCSAASSLQWGGQQQ